MISGMTGRDPNHARPSAALAVPATLAYNRANPLSADANVTSDNLVDIDDLHFSYDRRVILHGVDMHIPRGKIIAIMGGSGSGKTTLLRLIAGQARASRGSVRVDGEDVARLTPTGLYQLRRKMGMLYQFGALFTDLSVFDNVAFQMREHTRLPETLIHDLVLMKLHAVGLRGAARLMPNELSGGMARRVALARAIALDPCLMMYDEPFTGLDPISLGVIAQLIRDLNQALGTTTIMVTHDVEQSLQIVDYVYFLSQGKVAFAGTPSEIRASQDPFIHQFVFGETDGPVKYHYPAKSYARDLGLETQHA
jgi:phospholipid/cholesterol/gamma-HCH transport system ATP-binding protein